MPCERESSWWLDGADVAATPLSVDPRVTLAGIAATTSMNGVNESPSLDSVKRFE